MGITLQPLLDLKRKPLHAAPHVRVAVAIPTRHPEGIGITIAAPSELAEISAEDAPAQIRTRASFTSTTIRPGSEEGAAVGEDAATAPSISTGAKPETCAAFRVSHVPRYAWRKVLRSRMSEFDGIVLKEMERGPGTVWDVDLRFE